jgi:PAS domain S-box-containing protein
LRAQLEEAQEMFRALRSGEVDALVLESVVGPQVYTIQGLDAETNRRHASMLAQVSDAVIAVGNDGRIVYLNAAAERLYGLAAFKALGQTLSKLYESRWLRPEDEVAATIALRERGEWRGESVHVRQVGSELHVEASITVLREISGQPAGMLSVIRDVTERKQDERKLLVSELRYRRLFEAAHDGILILDPFTSKIIDANPFMTEMLGYSLDQLIGKELFEIGLHESEAASREMVLKLKETNHIRYENLPLESQGGRRQDVEVVANRYDENGSAVIQFNIRDISARRQSEEHVKLLMAEVNHRAKNLLAVVQAVSQLTSKHGDPATFVKRLSDRIGGLAAGQDLLVTSQWEGVEVSDLVEAQLAHFKDLIGTRVLIEGPRARLIPAAAQGVGMALHELATNAVKYGALSNLQGSINITWGISTDAKPAFSMSWLERGGPKMASPIGKGFGHIVMGRMAAAAVKGTADIVFGEGGLSWNLNAPAETALA